MRRLIILGHIILFGCFQLMANPVTVSQAKERANQFLNKHAAKRAPGKTTTTKTLKMMEAGKDDSYYIFNVEKEGGYVVVSGDDATEEILGYSDTGSIDPDNMPCNMRALFDSYTEQIQFLRENGITREQNVISRSGNLTPILLDENRLARYDQFNPYNLECPQYGSIFDRKTAATGCAATAMAQLMYYHKWPNATTKIIPAYITKTQGFERAAIPNNTIIDWANIRRIYNQYDGEGNKTKLSDVDQDVAIANLMKYAGTSICMDYAKEKQESGAPGQNIPYALQQYFGYNESICFKYRRYYSSETWNDMLYNELSNNGPIIYFGKSEDERHGFLLEGSNGDGSYFINFGWDDQENDWFFLDLVNGRFNFIYDQGAVFNAIPSSNTVVSEIPFHFFTEELKPYNSYVFTRNSDSQLFENISVWMNVANYMCAHYSCFYGFRFIDSFNTAFDYYFDSEFDIDYSQYSEGEIVFTYGNNLLDGKYKIYGISKDIFANDWLLNDNFENEYIDAIICNDKLAFKFVGEVIPQLNLFYLLQTSDALLRVGQPTEFSYVIENSINSYVDFYDGAIIGIVEWKEGGVEKEKPIFIDEIQVQPNGLSVVKGFTFTPLVAGEQDIVFYNKSWEEIGRQTFNAIPANESLDMLEVTDFRLIDGDMDRLLIDGTYLRANISMKNLDAVIKKADIKIGLTDVVTQTKRTKTIAVNIESNSTVGYNFGFGNLTAGTHYIVTASYPNGEIFYTSPELLCTTEGLGEVEPGNESLVQYEYWFDDDFANRQIVGMDSNSAVIRANIKTNNLTFGPHRFNFRVKRSDNMYSAVTSSLFFKNPAGRASSIEYWLDGDRNNITTVRGSLASDGLDYIINDSINLGAVTPGHHRLYCRAVSDDGRIASAVTMTPIIVKSKYAGITPADVKITNYSIAVDNGEPITFTLPSPGQDVAVEKKYNARNLTTGNHQLTLRFNNSIGAGVSENSTFSVKNQETPVINLTAQESDGLVNIRFNSIPNDINYRIYRVDANGALAQLNQIKGSYYPNDISLTDNPPTGTFRYYAKGRYETIDGTPTIVQSNEADVTLDGQETETTEYGYISGDIQAKVYGFFGKSRYVAFSDGETVKCDNFGHFYREKVPVGKHLTVTVETGDEYQSTTEEIAVKAGSNTVHLMVEKKNEYQLVDSDSPLQFTSAYAEVELGQYFRFEVENVSGFPWEGTISVKVLSKEYVDNPPGTDISLPTSAQAFAGSMATYTARQNFSCAYSDKLYIGAGKTAQVQIPASRILLDATQQQYYFYFECNDGFSTKLIEVNPNGNISSNPMLRLVESVVVEDDDCISEEDVTFAVNLIMHMLGGVKEIDGKLGDFSNYLSVFKESVGYNLEYVDFDYLSQRVERAMSYDELFYDNMRWHFNTIVYCEANNFENEINKFRDQIATLVRKSDNLLKTIKDVQQVLDYAKAYNEWQGMDDTERMIYFTERILDFAASHGDPFVKILKTYLDVTRITIANAKLLGATWHGNMDADWFSSENQLFESERTGSLRHNKFLDFRIRVKKEDTWWRLIDSYFDAEDVKKQIYDVTVTARNKMGNQGDFKAEATFTPVVDGDYVYLRQTGIKDGLSEGNPIEDMWLNIRWKNGRTTRVPLRHGKEVKGNGVKYDGFANPWCYTVTFQSGTSDDDHIADIIRLDD